MLNPRFDRLCKLGTTLMLAIAMPMLAAAATHYEPTLESLNRHPLPAWYADAKLGIFVHWGLYSVPGWAPLVHPNHDFTSARITSRTIPMLSGISTLCASRDRQPQAYHREHYGASYDYYNFAPVFDKEIQKWNPDTWAKVFHDAGAKYVVLTTKHHDGFTLWPSTTPNPTLAADRSQHATRDLVGDLSTAVRKEGLRMGLYYSGGYDWTFVPGPIVERVRPSDGQAAKRGLWKIRRRTGAGN